MVLNPKSKFYQQLAEVAEKEYEDLLWSQDAIFLERNSRSFQTRVQQINQNAERICEYLKMNPKSLPPLNFANTKPFKLFPADPTNS